MNPLSDRINNLAVSQTLAMAALARELKAQGKDIISLSLGEPDFNTPEFIKEAAKKAIDENYSTYTPVEGYLELKEAICKKFKRDNNLDYKPSQIVVSTGAKQSLYNIAQVMLNDGDEVILPAPYWVSYFEIIKLSGGVPVEVPTSVESDFKITPEQFLKWAKNNPQDFEELFYDEMLDTILNLEQDDYFGTEGFDKRFA